MSLFIATAVGLRRRLVTVRLRAGGFRFLVVRLGFLALRFVVVDRLLRLRPRPVILEPKV
jgi:hypothetical protein